MDSDLVSFGFVQLSAPLVCSQNCSDDHCDFFSVDIITVIIINDVLPLISKVYFANLASNLVVRRILQNAPKFSKFLYAQLQYGTPTCLYALLLHSDAVVSVQQFCDVFLNSPVIGKLVCGCLQSQQAGKLTKKKTCALQMHI